MSTVINFSDPRLEYGFLSTFYPAPFIIDNIRWRTVEHYYNAMKTDNPDMRDEIRLSRSPLIARQLGNDIPMGLIRSDWNDVQDNILYNALLSKFKDNASILDKLLNTAPNILMDQSIDNRLGILLMKVRDSLTPEINPLNGTTQILYDNLYSILNDQGFSTIIYLNGDSVNIPILDGPRVDTSGMILRGKPLEKQTKPKIVQYELAIIDIYIHDEYTKTRMNTIIEKYKHDENKPIYYVIAQLNKTSMNEMLRKAAFANIRFFSPSELYVVPSRSMLTPSVTKLTSDNPIYNYMRSIQSKLPELSASDKFAKEKGLVQGDIILVYDFSPHYRVIV